MNIISFILSGHKCQYKFFIEVNQLDSKKFPRLTSFKQLRDNPNASIVKVGTYWLNPLYERVEIWEEKRKKSLRQ